MPAKQLRSTEEARRGIEQAVEAVGTERTTCSHRPQGNKNSPRERRSRSTWCRSEQIS